MFVDSILSHAEFGQNDHQKDAPPFRLGQSRSRRKRMIPKKADNPDSGFLRREQTIFLAKADAKADLMGGSGRSYESRRSFFHCFFK